MSLSAKILAARDFKTRAVSTPEWPEVDGEIYVRTCSARERVEIGAALRNMVKDDPQADARMVAWSACDKDGQRIFSDDQIADLSTKNSETLDRIIHEWLDLNGLTKAASKDTEKKS